MDYLYNCFAFQMVLYNVSVKAGVLSLYGINSAAYAGCI